MTFIEKALLKHGEVCDYSEVEYINAHTKVTIICPKHGRFEQTPDAHLRSNNPCNVCAYEDRKLTIAHNNYKKFIDKSYNLYGDTYDYSLIEPDTFAMRKKVTIICPVHGETTQVAYSHCNGHHCKACSLDKTRIITYTKRAFDDNPALRDIPGLIYYIKFTDKQTHDVFYKIGITKYDLKRRFHKMYHDKYTLDVIDTYNTTIYNAYLIEQHIKTTHYDQRYIVNDHKFMGRTECFSCDVLDSIKIEEISNGIRH